MYAHRKIHRQNVDALVRELLSTTAVQEITQPPAAAVAMATQREWGGDPSSPASSSLLLSRSIQNLI